MSGNKLLFDTNIIIYLSKGELALGQFAKKGDELFISIITYMELKGFPFSSKNEEDKLDSICSFFEIIQLDDAIVETVISLRKKNKIKLPDAIIMATALVHQCSLVTRNTKDFNNHAPQIALLNPFSEDTDR